MTLPSKLKKDDDGSDLMFPYIVNNRECNYVNVGEVGSPATVGKASVTELRSGASLKALITFESNAEPLPDLPIELPDLPTTENIISFHLVRTFNSVDFSNVTYVALSITDGGGFISKVYAYHFIEGGWNATGDFNGSLLDNMGDYLSFPKIVSDNCRISGSNLITGGTLQLILVGLAPRLGGGYNIFIDDTWTTPSHPELSFKNVAYSDIDVPEEFINHPIKNVGISKTNRFSLFLNGIPPEHVFINELIPVGCEGSINSFKAKIFTDGGVYDFFVNGQQFTETPSIFRDDIFKDYLSTLGVVLNAYDDSGNLLEIDENGRYDTATTAEFINNSSEYVTFEIAVNDASSPDEFLPPLNGSAEWDASAGILTFCLAPAT